MVQNLVTKKQNNPLSKIVALALAVALMAMMVAPAYATATYSVTASYDFSEVADINNGVSLLALHPSATTSRSGVTQTFNASVEGYLWNITIIMWRHGTPNANLGMTLQGTGNDLNADPNGTVLETSTTTYNAIDLTQDTQTNYTFQFSGTYLLQQYQAYAWVLTVTSQVYQDADNLTRVGKDITASTDEGYQGTYRSSAWDGPTELSDFIYEVKVVSNFGGSGGTDYTDTTSDTDATITAFVSFMVPLIVMMLPAFLLCFITRRVDKWLILIGLAIGAGLGYYFNMVPLWLVFLITIGLIGMAYQSVKGGA